VLWSSYMGIQKLWVQQNRWPSPKIPAESNCRYCGTCDKPNSFNNNSPFWGWWFLLASFKYQTFPLLPIFVSWGYRDVVDVLQMMSVEVCGCQGAHIFIFYVSRHVIDMLRPTKEFPPKNGVLNYTTHPLVHWIIVGFLPITLRIPEAKRFCKTPFLDPTVALKTQDSLISFHINVLTQHTE
jgi:hypothetical protein